MPLKVYYVDDEPELCELFNDLFSSSEIIVTTFTDPIVALKIIQENPPDLLFMDFRMPGLNGLEMAKKLSPQLKKYLISGENNLAMDYPFQAILKKPFNIKEIRELIQTALSPWVKCDL